MINISMPDIMFTGLFGKWSTASNTSIVSFQQMNHSGVDRPMDYIREPAAYTVLLPPV